MFKGSNWLFIDSTKLGITCGNGAVATNLSHTVILPPFAAWGLVTHFSHCTSLNWLSGDHGHSTPHWFCKSKCRHNEHFTLNFFVVVYDILRVAAVNQENQFLGENTKCPHQSKIVMQLNFWIPLPPHPLDHM